MEIREDAPLFVSVPALLVPGEDRPAPGVDERRGRDGGRRRSGPARRAHLRLVGVEDERGPHRSQRTDGTRSLREALAVMLGLAPRELDRLSSASTVTAITRLHSLVERVQRLEARATVDDLTGALRREAGISVLQGEIDRARERADGRLAAIALHVDGLRSVNEASGRAAGDELLVAVAEALRQRLGSYDPVIRTAGDRFLGSVYGADLGAAEVIAGELREVVRLATGGQTVSTGVAELEPGDDARGLAARAARAVSATPAG